MLRLAARRLWTRRLQALAPLIALLAATLGFQAVLVSARSTQSHVVGVIAADWNPPYDLLVRPASLVTGLKPGDHLIQPNYLDSAQGGITMAQVGMVRSTSGVSVAAPVGVVAIDYLWGQDYGINLAQLPRFGDLTAYRLTTTLITDGGLSTTRASKSYTHLLLQGNAPPFISVPDDNSFLNLGANTVDCYYIWCYTNPTRYQPAAAETFPFTAPWANGRYGYDTGLTAAVVAVDPAAEAALSGVDHCLLSGRNLTAADAVVGSANADPYHPDHIPVLMNVRPGYDDKIGVTVEAAPAAALVPIVPSLVHETGRRYRLYPTPLDKLTYRAVAQFTTDLNAAWNGTNGIGFTHGSLFFPAADQAIDSVGPITYTGSVPNLAAKAVSAGDGFTPYQLLNTDPPSEADLVAFHTLQQVVNAHTPWHDFNVVGEYDPNCVNRASSVATTAFDIYANPDTTTPSGRRLGPNASMSNFVTPMPTLMTNLDGGQWFSSLDPTRVANHTTDAFLSVIRVKVSGTEQPGSASQTRLERVAAAIHQRTGLAVDIIKGSSAQTMSVALPAGLAGRPAMTVRQDWLRENVAINFYNAINATTVVMSIVVAVVAVLLTMQTTYATVRRRRGELVLLRAIGWPSWRLALLMELEVIALGVLVALVAVAVAGFIILVNHPGGGVEIGILLAAPAAIALTAIAGAGPAFIASKTRPLAALRGPGRLRRRRRRLIRGPFSLGIREALTTWRWQTLLGALATAVGALFLGAVLAIVHDFHVSLDSTALAQQLSNEVGPFDVLLGVLAVALGAITAVSVVLVATRERLPHFATLRALGWSRVRVAQVVAGQAISVGLLGGVLGVIALTIVANRVKTGIALTWSSQLCPLVLGLATGVAAAIGAVRLVYRRVIVTVLRVG